MTRDFEPAMPSSSSGEGETSECTLSRHSLQSIVGVHPVIESVFTSLSIPPLRQVPDRALTAERIETILSIVPLRVTKMKGRLWCSGNVRQFQLARRFLSTSTTVLCIEEPPQPVEQLTRRFLRELTDIPACLGAHFSDVPVLAEIIRKAVRAGHFQDDAGGLDQFIAALYGIDRRRLKPAKETQAASPVTSDANLEHAHLFVVPVAPSHPEPETQISEAEPVTATEKAGLRGNDAYDLHKAAARAVLAALREFGWNRVDQLLRMKNRAYVNP